MEADPEKEQKVYFSGRRVEADLEKEQNVCHSGRRVEAELENEQLIKSDTNCFSGDWSSLEIIG